MERLDRIQMKRHEKSELRMGVLNWIAGVGSMAQVAVTAGTIAGCIMSAASFAATPPPEKPWVPEYTLMIKDAAHAAQLLKENPWALEFKESNLFQGVMIRLAPVLFMLGENQEKTESSSAGWSGRLIDDLYEKILRGHLVSVAYYGRAGLVSPFGFSIHNLGSVEKSLVEALLKQFKNGAPQVINHVTVQPIRLRSHKFAAVLNGDCLTLSRDPQVTARALLQCRMNPNLNNDAQWRISLSETSAPLYTFASRFMGLESELLVNFKWDSSGKRFVPSGGELPLFSNHLLLNGKLPESMLQAVPAQTSIFATLSLPTIDTLEPSAVTDYLKKTPADLRTKKPLSVALLFMGMEPPPAESFTSPVGMSAVLVPALRKKGQSEEQMLEAVSEIFNEKTTYEVKIKPVCKDLIAISRSVAAIELIEKACKKSIPSFAQMPDSLQKALKNQPLAASLFLDFGKWLSSATEFGWKTSEKDPIPPEVERAQRLLGQLPHYLLVGQSSADKLTLQGVE